MEFPIKRTKLNTSDLVVKSYLTYYTIWFLFLSLFQKKIYSGMNYQKLQELQGDNFKIGQTLRFVQKWKMMWMFPLFYVVSCLFSWFFKSPGVLYLFWELWSTLNSTMTDPSSSCTKCLLKTTPPPLGYPLVPGGVRREFQNLISGVWCSTIKF